MLLCGTGAGNWAQAMRHGAQAAPLLLLASKSAARQWLYLWLAEAEHRPLTRAET